MKTIPALKVKQWLHLWDDFDYNEQMHRTKPDDHFFLLSIKARDLRVLSGIYPRVAAGRARATEDLGVQRRHDPTRSEDIKEFVQFGHPWPDLSVAQQNSGECEDLKKPGWLPTTIVVNILKAGNIRKGKTISDKDVIRVVSDEGSIAITLPDTFVDDRWKTSSIPPVEVIDGQHRLWAFEEDTLDGEFELPVVAYHGLDISWQAYLFYTINIKPKRINASLAFDLYPLLRTEDWLNKFSGPIIYRETRAQELVDLLYSCPKSPWYQRINMLGESKLGQRMVSQAAWIRSLLATFVKSWDNLRTGIGGLFGSAIGEDEQVLPWRRQEQAAFLILAGDRLKEHVTTGKEKWQEALRYAKNEFSSFSDDPAFAGQNTLIAQDQGIRSFLSVVNDLCFLNSDNLDLFGWGTDDIDITDDLAIVDLVIESGKNTVAYKFLDEIALHLSKFDWRSSTASGLDDSQKLLKLTFRGSGGYREMRRQLLLHMKQDKGNIAELASAALDTIG